MKQPIHFWSADGSSLPLALRLQHEGHPITWHVKSPDAKDIGRGLVTRAGEPPKGSLVIFDTTGQGALGTSYRQRGHLVIGGNPFDKSLELERPEGVRIMRKGGIVTPPTFPFADIPSALRFLKKADGAWFVKVSGDTVESSTCDAPDPETMIRYLTWVQSKGKVEPFELQQTVEGIEVSVNGWFNGQQFLEPFDITLEEKKFLAGDQGPRTGCESCVVWHASDTKLGEITVEPIADQLEAAGYVGLVDLNSLIDVDGTPQGLEWTARLGFDATQAWMRLFDGDLGEQLEAFASGDLLDWEPRASGSLSGVLRVSIPPYPTWEPKLISKTKGLPLDPAILSDPRFDPVDVMENAQAAGGSGIIGTCAALGTSIPALQKGMLAFARSLNIPHKQFRIDPLSRCEKDMAGLAKLGLLGLKEKR